MKSNKIKNMLVVASVVISTTLVGSTSAFAATLPLSSSASLNSSSKQSLQKTTTKNQSKTTDNNGEKALTDNTKNENISTVSNKAFNSIKTSEVSTASKDTTLCGEIQYGEVSNLGNGYTSLNLRQGPVTSYNIIGELSSGTNVQIISQCNSNWYKVQYNGTTGYVYAPCISIVSGNLSSSSKTGTVINLSGDIQLNFRLGPSTNDTVIGGLSEGTTFTILSESNGWYKINYDGTIGYVYGYYVSVGNNSSSLSNSSSNTSKSGVVSNLNSGVDLNFRSGPNTDYSIIGELSEGTSVTILSENNGWYKINYDGTVGYVYSNYISIGSASSNNSTNASNNSTATVSKTSVSKTSVSKSNSSKKLSDSNVSNNETTNSSNNNVVGTNYANKVSYTAPSDLVDFTASYEGFSATPYWSGGWTVGFGQNHGNSYPQNVTYQEALNTLQGSLTTYMSQVKSLTQGCNLNQNQINALTDFAYNLGIGSLENSQLLQDIKNGNTNASTIMTDFQSWSYIGGSFSSGLYARRTAEAQMFLYGQYNDHQ